ncbi:MAG TPA: hypothetical protein VGT82_13485, partial [Ktedonobacteraceae bacterium]|nr:hypothetical protein [Ktedonobacteraceae bacterium]
QKAAQFAGTLNVRNPVVFFDPQDNYSQNLASDFEAQFVNDGFAMPHEETFTANKTKDFSSLMQDALNKYNPDAFYFTSSSN